MCLSTSPISDPPPPHLRPGGQGLPRPLYSLPRGSSGLLTSSEGVPEGHRTRGDGGPGRTKEGVGHDGSVFRFHSSALEGALLGPTHPSQETFPSDLTP